MFVLHIRVLVFFPNKLIYSELACFGVGNLKPALILVIYAFGLITQDGLHMRQHMCLNTTSSVIPGNHQMCKTAGKLCILLRTFG